MDKIIARKNDNFTIVDNEILRDKTISLKAKAIHITVMSLPDNWDFSVKGIAEIVKEGRTAVSTAINELKEHGYCEYIKKRNDKGHFVHNYIFYQSKALKEVITPDSGNPVLENPDVEVPVSELAALENLTQIKNIKNKILNNQELNKTNTPLYSPARGEINKSPVLNSQFEEFWNLYGRRGKKSEAETAFIRALKKVDFTTLIGAVQEYIGSHDATRDGGKYKMHASTYLNGQCWDSKWKSGNISFSSPSELQAVWHELPEERKKNIEAVAWLRGAK